MSETLRGHFGGTVVAMDKDGATIAIETLYQTENVAKGDLVRAFRADLAPQLPGVALGGYVEGNVLKDEAGANKFINVTRIV